LLNLRAGLGLREAAHFLTEAYNGTLPDAVIADLYQIADALFLPSKEEGFGIPLLEAAFHRVPAFCSDIAALRELGGKEVTFFDLQANPAEIAGRIARRLHDDPGHTFRARAWREATWEAVFARHIAPLIER